MDITNIAMASMRHHTSLRETAEIATAALIDAKIITKNNTLMIIDHSKVKRAQEKLAIELANKFNKDLENNVVSCIFFDGRKDNTKVLTEFDGTPFVLVFSRKSIILSLLNQVENIYFILFLIRLITENMLR
jgi:hypothetical protein